MLLLASRIFNAFCDYRFLSLIFASTTVDYLAGWAIHVAILLKSLPLLCQDDFAG
jgi:hypothetical protein